MKAFTNKISLILLMTVMAAGCGGGGGDGDSVPITGITVSGSVTLPDSVTDKQWFVGIDDDLDGDNGQLASVTGVVTGSTFNYSIGNVPSGDYFIYGEVDMTDTLGPWNVGDYVGVGCGTIDSPCKVTIDSSKTVDFTLVEMPDGSDSLTVTGASGNQVALDGRWSAGCQLNEDVNMELEVTSISGSSFSISSNHWKGVGTCSGLPALATNISGTLILGDEVIVLLNGSPVTATKAELAVSSALFTYYDADWVEYGNTNGACGATDWVAGTAKEVVGTVCMPANFEDIIYIDDTVDPDLMYDQYDIDVGSTPDKRVFGYEANTDYAPYIIADTCNITAGGYCIAVIYNYQSGLLVGITTFIYVKNIGGAGMIDVAVTVGAYTENKQFAVDEGARYTLSSMIFGTQSIGPGSFEFSALLQDYSETTTFDTSYWVDVWYPGDIYIPTEYHLELSGPPSSSFVLQ